MSINYKLFAVAAVAALAIMGCGKKEQHTAPATTQPPAEAPAAGGAPTTPPAQPGGGAPK